MTHYFFRRAILTLSILFLFVACGEPDEPLEFSLECGPGTFEEAGVCLSESGPTCGAGTREQDGVCVPSEGLLCGQGTREVSGQCVPDNSDGEGDRICGPGTIEEAGICVGSEDLSCGAGTVEQSGVCVPDGPAGLEPPRVTMGTTSLNLVVGQTGELSFQADADHSWQFEKDGYFRGDGDLLATGTGTANSLQSIEVVADQLGIGQHLLRLYVFVEVENTLATATVEIPVTVRGDLRGCVWGDHVETRSMLRDNIRLDPRVSHAQSGGITNTMESLDSLLNYDVVVLLWMNENNSTNMTHLGNRLAQYVDAGGAVVIWPMLDHGWPTGNWSMSRYAPLRKMDAQPFSTTSAATIGTVVSNHPIMEGVSSLSVAWRPLSTVDEDAELIASWSDGVPLVAAKGPVVSIGWRITTRDPDPTGDWQTLLLNSIIYAVGNLDP